MANIAMISCRITSSLIIAICLYIGAAAASDEQTKIENAAFKEAVEAVKDKNYSHAIELFEKQAKLARHDAQYNLAVLLNRALVSAPALVRAACSALLPQPRDNLHEC